MLLLRRTLTLFDFRRSIMLRENFTPLLTMLKESDMSVDISVINYEKFIIITNSIYFVS